MTRILFATVFKPFGIDNQFSRRDSYPEIFHNRLTRAQGVFSYRSHFSALGLHAIANNISAQSTVLEYPTFKLFLKEIEKDYDYVGIGSVVANFQKVREMARAIREISPRSRIVIGGYCAHIEHIREMVPLDHLCKGEGISFMRELLGDPPEFRFKNPDIYTRLHSFLGVPLFGRKSPQIIIGLGCPYGCEYCSSSYHFDRKYIRFFKTGEEIFREMKRLERSTRSRNFGFHGDDNFLVDLKRADELRECIIKSGKQYEIFHFATADKAKEFGAERMAEMGSSLVWIGRESGLVSHHKYEGVDMKALVEDCHRHGIKVIISSMLLMEHHTPENIWEDMEDHYSLKPDFSMFAFCSTGPGTPLYDKMKKEDRILWGYNYEDWNGLWRQYTQHPHFSPMESQKVRERILEREYHALGPSVMRIVQTDLTGYRYMKESENPNLRRRAERLAKKMPMYRALLWACARLTSDFNIREMITDVLSRVENEFGPVTALEKTGGAGLWLFGTKERLRNRFLGDMIQPPTTVTRYSGRK
jgi:haloalkane dehalogenase